METPLVSICIPTYNGQRFLEISVNSAIEQTYKNIEIIIVDDCSTDSTWDIATKYAAKDARVKLFRNEKNAGLVRNWNRCVELATGEWIKFLFQDDYLSPDCIEAMVNSISPNDRIVTSARRLILDESLDEATKAYSTNETLTFERLGFISPAPVFISREKIASLISKNICMNFIGEPTVIMFQKEVTGELGTFNPDLIQICDLEYFLRIACNYGIKYVPQPLTYFRVHKGSASTSNISERMFSMINLDPIIMVHQLLYASFFTYFREALSISQKMKLKIFFMLRVHEAYKNAVHSTPENLKKFETVEKKYSEITRFKEGTILIRILLEIIKLRRTIRNKTLKKLPIRPKI